MIETPLPGDAILYPLDDEISSKLVAIAQIIAGLAGRANKNYTHGAVLSAERGMQYEAVFPHFVHSRIDTKRAYEIWRFGNPTVEDRKAILSWCMERARRRSLYDLVGVCTGGIIHMPYTYYCTRALGEAYKTRGIGVGDEIFSPDSMVLPRGAMVPRMILRVEPERKRP